MMMMMLVSSMKTVMGFGPCRAITGGEDTARTGRAELGERGVRRAGYVQLADQRRHTDPADPVAILRNK